MVKGTTRQVIVVQSPDKKLFDQAIFILKDDAVGITDEMLLKEARQIIRGPIHKERKQNVFHWGPVWACCGAILTGIFWIVTAIF